VITVKNRKIAHLTNVYSVTVKTFIVALHHIKSCHVTVLEILISCNNFSEDGSLCHTLTSLKRFFYRACRLHLHSFIVALISLFPAHLMLAPARHDRLRAKSDELIIAH